MRNSYPLAYVAAFLWPVFAAAVSFGQVAATQPGVAPGAADGTAVILAAPATAPAPLPADFRIAVLPFVATNPQAGNAWIGKSIQQSLSADLLQLAPARVQTADTVADTSADAVAAGRRLGVHYVVFGTYSSTDQALRIVGQVVDASSGTAVGALKVTGLLGQVFLLEDGVSREARTAIFGQAAADSGPGYTVHELPDNGAAAQTYTPPNGAATDVSAAQTPDSSMQYGQAYISSPDAGAYSYSYPAYSYYPYPYYTYGYPYYGYAYPGAFFGFRFGNGFHDGFHGGFHGGGGGFHGGGGGFHGGGGGMHGGGGHR